MNRESHHWSTVRAEWILLHGGETCSTNPCSSVGFRVSFYGVDSLHSRWGFSTRSAWTGLFHLFSRSDALAERESQAALGHFLRGAWSLLQVWSISQLALSLTLLCVQEGAGGVEGWASSTGSWWRMFLFLLQLGDWSKSFIFTSSKSMFMWIRILNTCLKDVLQKYVNDVDGKSEKGESLQCNYNLM